MLKDYHQVETPPDYRGFFNQKLRTDKTKYNLVPLFRYTVMPSISVPGERSAHETGGR
jgi:hypothetical protein